MIRVLDGSVADRIAAGEVIERPASVVKELVENAIDAGARKILVDVRGAGKELIRVIDDGHGIAPDEAPLAFVRHATSKIRSAEDLNDIRSLGFRGEALPSIASVARVTMITRRAEQAGAVRVEAVGGQLKTTPWEAPPGTQVEVCDLFYNTPARFKFLKSDTAERKAVADLLTAVALAQPHVAITCRLEGKEYFATPGTGNPKEAIAALFSRSVLSELLPVEAPLPWGAIFGYIGKPSIARGNRSAEMVFVNGRWIQNRVLYAAVEKGYESLLAFRRYPTAFLHVTIDPSLIDVNVHPAKTEIRFKDESDVFRQVMRAVRSTLSAADLTVPLQGQPDSAPRPHGGGRGYTESVRESRLVWATPWPAEPGKGVREGVREAGPAPWTPSWGSSGSEAAGLMEREPLTSGDSGLPADAQAARDVRAAQAEAAATTWAEQAVSGYEAEAPRDRPAQPPAHPRELLLQGVVLGQLDNTYLVVQVPMGLWLIDQHVAHERILYEEYLHTDESGALPAQELLMPEQITFTPAQAAVLADAHPVLSAAGFALEPFGGRTYLIRAVPATLKGRPGAVILGILDELTEEHATGTSMKERTAAAVACRAAVKAGDRLQPEESAALLHGLARLENPFSCPHGRPIIVQIDLREIARRFGRE